MRGGAVGERVEDEVPAGVGRVGRRVVHLAADAGEVARGLHEVGHHGVAGIADFVKTLDAVIVRIAAGEHHVARRHAVADLHECVRKAQALAGETIHVGREVAGLRAVDADGIATHIIGGDDEHVEALGGGAGERSYGEECAG